MTRRNKRAVIFTSSLAAIGIVMYFLTFGLPWQDPGTTSDELNLARSVQPLLEPVSGDAIKPQMIPPGTTSINVRWATAGRTEMSFSSNRTTFVVCAFEPESENACDHPENTILQSSVDRGQTVMVAMMPTTLSDEPVLDELTTFWTEVPLGRGPNPQWVSNLAQPIE